ncbi:MAG TPA: Maf family protein, partial [Methylocella sp.]|nr:Maf family protein [Methylocella sp.]
QLALLSGRTHELHSGYCVARENAVLSSGVAVARLSCRHFSADFIEAYLLETGAVESAGGYRIEGLGIHLFEKIEGDHTTILGLPLLPLLKFLRDEGSVLA